MKKISLYIAAAFLLTTQSCNDFVSKDDNTPNDPSSATLQTLLPVTEVALFATYTGQISRNASIYVQHSAGTDQQMVDVAQYILSETDVTNDWTTIYNAGVVNTKQLQIDANNAKAPYYVGIAKVLQAMFYGIATDCWGDIPTTQAGLGRENLTPKHEPQEQVIIQIQELLSSAIVDFEKPTSANATLPAGDDYIHGGDVTKWKKTAWMLKARYANRLSKRNAATSATQALTFLTNAGLSGGSDDANAIFGSAGNELNSWAAFEQQRGNYIKMSSTLIDTLKKFNDPRLSIYAKKDDAGGYSGTALNDAATNTSSIGDALLGNSLPLVTYAEAKFIEAEASLRGGNTANAQTAYTEAITSAMARYGVSDVTAYLAANGTLSGDDANKLRQIMTQKWIASFTQPEAWTDWRRTGYPALTPNPGATITQIPRRYPTEQAERLYNKNAVVVSNNTARVWWDQ